MTSRPSPKPALPAADQRLLVACRKWRVEVEAPLAADFSSVLAVRLPDGRPGIAKLAPPGDDDRDAAAALAAWGGDGAVRLLAQDHGVLLLERAEPGTAARDDEAVASCLRRLWIRPPASVGWRLADDLLARWTNSILRWRAALGDERADAAAAEFGEGLGDGPRVLLHGDGHHGNVLDGGERGWLAIDPHPLVGPAALDLVPALHNGPVAPVGERIALLAGETGVDAAELRRLALPRLVLSAAWVLDDGYPITRAERALAVADELLGH